MTLLKRVRSVRPQTTSDTSDWRNATVPQWMPPHLMWRVFVAGLVVMVCLILSTVLVWALLTDQAKQVEAEDRRVARTAARKVKVAHAAAQQRECEALRDRLDAARANDITSLQFQSNLHLDLSDIPIADPYTRIAIALAWEKALKANAFFVLVRLNRTVPIECVRGKSIQLPYREYDITGTPTVTFFVPQPGDQPPARTSTPPPGVSLESPAPVGDGDGDGGDGGSSASRTACRKITKKGKCVPGGGAR